MFPIVKTKNVSRQDGLTTQQLLERDEPLGRLEFEQPAAPQQPLEVDRVALPVQTDRHLMHPSARYAGYECLVFSRREQPQRGEGDERERCGLGDRVLDDVRQRLSGEGVKHKSRGSEVKAGRGRGSGVCGGSFLKDSALCV